MYSSFIFIFCFFYIFVKSKILRAKKNVQLNILYTKEGKKKKKLKTKIKKNIKNETTKKFLFFSCVCVYDN